MGKNSVVAIIAVIILIVAIVMIARSMSGGSGSAPAMGDIFWYDTGSKELYAGPHEMPPLKAPSGSEGVQAHVFAKGSCDNAGDRFIVYLEKYPDKEAVMNAPTMAERMPLMEQRLVRRENDAEWVEAGSPDGVAILAEADAARQSGTACVEYKK